MKKIKLVFPLIMIVIMSLIVFYWIKNAPQAKAADPIRLTSCGTLSTAGTASAPQIYILDNDVSATGTCFTSGVNYITLDLNGHTVTYNTGAGDNIYGFLSSWNPLGLRITNGSFVQGAGKGYKSYAIYIRQGKTVEIDHLNISYSGNDNMGIVDTNGAGGINIQIHDNVVRPNGTKRVLTHYDGFSAIQVGSTGNIDIYNNDIQGKGYSGISFGYSGILTDTLHINNNTIKMDTPVRDGYAISIASPNNNDIGFEIANNTIVQTSGRGILVNGNLSDNSSGPGLGTIHDNYVEVRESRDAGEYNAPGASTGICLRFGAHNIKVYNNTVKAYAGQNACPSSFTTSKGADCIARALKIHSGLYGKDNEIYNNIVTVTTTDAALSASGIYAPSDKTVSGSTNTIFHHNTVISNSIIVDLAGSDGSGSYQNFRSNTFIKGTNPLNFTSINAGYWILNSIGHIFLDNIWQNGAGGDNVRIAGSSPSDCSSGNCFHYDLTTQWYLNVTAKDSSSNLISGATVTAIATGGQAETVTGTTDAAGKAQLALSQSKRWGLTYPQSSNYNRYTPHTITVSKDGFGQAQAQATMDATKSLEMVLSPTISLTKQVDKTTANHGDTLTYTLSYSNPTANTYTNARIEDSIPVGTTFVSLTGAGTYDSYTNKVTWTLGNIAGGANGTVSFQVRIQ